METYELEVRTAIEAEIDHGVPISPIKKAYLMEFMPMSLAMQVTSETGIDCYVEYRNKEIWVCSTNYNLVVDSLLECLEPIADLSAYLDSDDKN